MIKRVLGLGAVALLLAASGAMAATPAGPRLAVVKLSSKGFELLSVNPNGGDPLRLAGGGRRAKPLLDFFSPVAWSADGEEIGFSGIIGFQGGDDHEPIRRLFTARADGSGLRKIRGTNGATGPVLSPDGHTVAFNRSLDREEPTMVGGKMREEFHGSSIWTVDLLTGAQHQLTPWQDGVYYTASSFSPDGSTMLATHEGGFFLSEAEPVALRIDGSGSRRIFDDGSSPVYSPDGSEIAFVRRNPQFGNDAPEGTDLWIVGADGTGVRRITRTRGLVEFFPSWDPSGERLAYIRFSGAGTEAAAFGVGDALMEVNADGTCKTRVLSSPRAAFYVPAWQPGPGRGAGRIEC